MREQHGKISMINRMAIRFVLIVAIAIPNLAAEKPTRAQQSTIRPPDLGMPDATHGKVGITHKSLLKSDIPGTSGQEVIVWDTEYAPRGINPRHYHPAAITFHVISGTGVWQEDGKSPLTLKSGDSLFVPAAPLMPTGIRAILKVSDFWNLSQAKKTKCAPSPGNNQTKTRLTSPSAEMSVIWTKRVS